MWGGEKTFKFNLQWVILWWKLVCKEELSQYKRNIEEEYMLDLCEADVAHRMRRQIPYQYFLLQKCRSPAKNWNYIWKPLISVKAGLLKLMSVATCSQLDQKKFEVIWRLWWGMADYKNITRFYYLL